MTGKPEELHRDPEAAADMAVNAVIKYLHGCGVTGEDQKRQWIKRVLERVISREFSQ